MPEIGQNSRHHIIAQKIRKSGIGEVHRANSRRLHNDLRFETKTPLQGGLHESVRDYYGDFSAACFRGSLVTPDFSGADNSQHHCDTDVDERSGMHRHRRLGNLAVVR